MNRDFKYAVPGILFYIFLIVPLLMSQNALPIIRLRCVSNEWLLPVLSLGLALVTTNGMGFIFVSISYFIFNVGKGYSNWFDTHLKNLDFVGLEESIKTEPKFVYRYWYKGKKDGNPYDAWVTRRWASYFANYSSLIAITLASSLSLWLIIDFNLGFTWVHLGWVVFLALFATSLIVNSCCAKRESLDLLNLFVVGENEEKDGKNDCK